MRVPKLPTMPKLPELPTPYFTLDIKYRNKTVINIRRNTPLSIAASPILGSLAIAGALYFGNPQIGSELLSKPVPAFTENIISPSISAITETGLDGEVNTYYYLQGVSKGSVVYFDNSEGTSKTPTIVLLTPDSNLVVRINPLDVPMYEKFFEIAGSKDLEGGLVIQTEPLTDSDQSFVINQDGLTIFPGVLESFDIAPLIPDFNDVPS